MTAGRQAHRLDIDGSWLHYERHGSGPLVVLVTGLGAVLDWWRPALPLLSATHTVIAHDLRGIGRSGPAQDVSVAAQARDVLALADSVGASTCTVVGASFGGCVVQELLCTTPHRLRAAGLLCSGPADLPIELLNSLLDPESPLARARRVAGVDDGTPIRDRLLADTPLLFRPGFPAAQPGRYNRWLDDVTAAHGAHIGPEATGYLMATAAHDRFADLPAVAVPVLAVIGADDAFIPAWVQQRDAAAIPTADVHVLPDGRHGLPLEDAETWVALLLRLLDRSDAASPR